MSAPHELLTRALEHARTPCFVFDFPGIVSRAASLRDAFGGRFEISFAMKANPNHELLRLLKAEIPCLDISSGGELERAIETGWEGERISFTGPGKTDRELDAALEYGVGEIVLESVNEGRRLSELATARGRVQDVAVRISPAQLDAKFGAQMAGRPTAFGIEEERIEEALREIRELPGIRLNALHLFAGAQCLDAEALSTAYRNYAELFTRVADAIDLQPERLIFGAGMGIRYHEHEKELDLAAIAKGAVPALDALRAQPRFANTRLVLELGRYLTGPVGYYLTRVIDKKSSRGKTFLICDGGMNHNLAAAGLMGMVIPRNYRFCKLGDSGEATETYQVTGPLCTALDTLGRELALPNCEVGDVIVMFAAGAYGASASPAGFISHPTPDEVVVVGEGQTQEFVVAGAERAAR